MSIARSVHSRRLLALLLVLGLAAAGCTPRGRGSSGRSSDDDDDDDSAVTDDDDTVGDDDDSVGDDDDTVGDDDDTVGDDDDTVGDDDDTVGDDDDTVGDDDDTVGDDDDSVSGYAWEDDTFCLDWTSGTWVSPDPTTLTLLQGIGFSFTSITVLMSPLSVNGSFLNARIGAGDTNCNQNLSWNTAEETGNWFDPDLEIGPALFALPLTAGAVTLENAWITGDFTNSSQLVDSTIDGLLDLGSLGGTLCGIVLPCQTCPSTLQATCTPIEYTNATWDQVSSSPLTLVP